jgi:hypothetical protein
MNNDSKCPEGVPRKRSYPQTDRHRQLVAALLAQGCLEGAFGEAVRAATGASPGIMQPDAYRIDVEAKAVLVYEVEVTHPIDAPKWRKLAKLAEALRECGWTLRLWSIDRRAAVVELDPFTKQPTEAEFAKAAAIMETWTIPVSPAR